MAKILSLILFILLIKSAAFAQKLAIDTSVFNKWPSVGQAKISNDGKFVLYVMDTNDVNNSLSRHFVLQSTENNWRMIVPNIDFHSPFTGDSKKSVFIHSSDSLAILTLGTALIDYIPQISFYKLCDDWLIYRTKSLPDKVTFRNLVNSSKVEYSKVKDIIFDSNNKGVVLEILNDSDQIELVYHDLTKNKQKKFWKGLNPSGIYFSKSHEQIAFTNFANEINTLWYYRIGDATAKSIMTDTSKGVTQGLKIHRVNNISNNGQQVFFTLVPTKKDDSSICNKDVEILSYLTPNLREQSFSNESFLAVINLASGKIVRLQETNEIIGNPVGKYVIVSHYSEGGDWAERYWNKNSFRSIYLVSTQDGKRTLLPTASYELSPNGNYAVYYDFKQRGYFAYKTQNGSIVNLSSGIKTNWIKYQNDYPDAAENDYGIQGWLKGGEEVLLRDQFDIWQISLNGKNTPINITNGYGSKSGVIFYQYNSKQFENLNHGTNLVVMGFDTNSKENGFYRITIGKKADPHLMSKGSYLYYMPLAQIKNQGEPPIKARNAEAYIINRMSATESPNLYFTKDFINFSPLTEIHPERKYNWLTSELINWKLPDGSIAQGILYKPENFDNKKKYPILFHYYEKFSSNLNVYFKPRPSPGDLDIPTYVSNDYLVFLPDIHYKLGYPGNSVLSTIISAAEHLATIPYIDAKKMGIQGHSFGGYETNYIIANTTIFSAACSAAGFSDIISYYGSGGIGQSMVEEGQLRIGSNLWNRPERFIENSPIFRANRIFTPLLMQNNKQDMAVPFSQAMELFTALRRLGKRVWLLQYYDEGHTLSKHENAMDFTIRMRQFFDHYLKDAPAPRWMTRYSVSENCLDFDSEIKTPGPGLSSDK
ncbi:prolyl oligopeptidase family serine peptidase [Chitinophaga filiformis]|uniref:alpha/beta hydrolase family protein n=1 Tax=Chitinophaga filiformis TaxID=104663 RepID=UPI001F44CE44|nr:prolyl oligopeptidase family serine peptidase [Chitinophaga filiformis]MCF6407517.1 prolyl oligopeptidase family serine peptidase [Chitinophaga filiformis]